MPIRRRVQAVQTKPELFGQLATLLLCGWSAEHVTIAGLPDDNQFRIFEYSDEMLAAAWRTHRTRLRREWRRRGHTGEPWAAQQFEHQTRTAEGTTE